MPTSPSIHPGEILVDELAELAVRPTEPSRQIKLPAKRVTQIIGGKRSITGDTALRLGHWFGTNAQFWLNLQSTYEVRIATHRGESRDRTAAATSRPGLREPTSQNNV